MLLKTRVYKKQKPPTDNIQAVFWQYSVTCRFFDGNGNELKKGDKVIMTLYGLGSGEMDIVEHENELCLYDATQGHYPLKFVVKRVDMFLERLP